MNTQFAYNGDGVRLRLVAAGTLTTYTQDYAAPLPVVLQARTGAAATQYVYSLGTRPVAEYEATAWEYLLPDPLGSVRQIANNSANVTLLKSYEPYGSVLISQGGAASIFGYSGEQVDNTGLIYLRARYMQPEVGIFLSRDMWEGDFSLPKTLNPYAYSLNNPVLLTDPSGKIPWWIFLLLLAACDSPDDSCLSLPDDFSSYNLEHRMTREGAIANIQIAFNIKLPPGYQFAFDPSVYTDYGVVGGYVPWFGQANHGKVFITEVAFTGVPPAAGVKTTEPFYAFDIAGIMVHEAVHAWQQYWVTKMLEDPNSDFKRSNTPPELSYLTEEWYDKYWRKPAEVQAEEYVLEHSPRPLCLSEAFKRKIRSNISDNSGDHPDIPGTESGQIELIGEPLP